MQTPVVTSCVRANSTQNCRVMAWSQSHSFLSYLLLISILCINQPAICHDDEEENLLRGINGYRATLNLSALTQNDKAECLAEEIVDQLQDQPCTYTTGANVPGVVPQFSDYPKLLARCKLNVTTTRDGAIMPACVPDLVQDNVLSNYTHSLYSGSLNDSKYTGIGIGLDDDWIVVIFTTNTSTGGFGVGSSDSGNSNTVYPIMLFLLLGALLLIGYN